MLNFLTEKELNLIDTCYINKYEFDFKQFHLDKCRVSEKEILLTNDINLSNRIQFSDSDSGKFRLIVNNRLVYLLGENSCYPCSNVVESAYGNHLNWVQCFVLPKGDQILGETDIRKSAVIVSFFTEIVAIIKDEETFFIFIRDLNETFSQCKWFKRIYSLSTFFKIAKFWNYHEKIKKLFDHGLLYPLELAIYSIYNDVEIISSLYVKYFVQSLAESTNKIFKQNEIYDLINSIGQKDINLLFDIESVKENIRFDLIDDDYFADLLDIDSNIRYPLFIEGKYYINFVQDRANELFEKPNFRNEYLTTLKRNFRDLENKLRKRKGFDNVGTFFMEQLTFNKLKEDFPTLTILTQHSPTWLSPQRFDIFILECNLAIEYNGIQHYEPIGFFGGEEGLKIIKVLDDRKKTKCSSNKVTLFEIRFDDDYEQIYAKLIILVLNLRVITSFN